MPRVNVPAAWRVCAIALLTATALPATPAKGQLGPRPTIISNVRVLDGDGAVHEGATIVIRGSRIDQVTTEPVRLRGAQVIDGTGMTATPGLIDVYGTLGLTGASWSDPTGQTFDAFDPFAVRLFEEVLAMGVTSAYLTPSGFTGVGAAGSIVRLGEGTFGTLGTPLRERAAVHIDLASGARAIDRLTVFDRVRAQFRAASGHGDALEQYEEALKAYLEALPEETNASRSLAEDPPPPPRPRGGGRRPPQPPPAEEAPAERPAPARAAASGDGPTKPDRPRANPGHEALLEAMRGEIPVRIRAHRSADITNALELAREFSLRIMIEGGAEASLHARELAEAGVPVVLAPPPDSDLELAGIWHRFDADAPAILVHAGVEIGFGSGPGSGAAARMLLDRTARGLGPHGGLVHPIDLLIHRAARLLGVEADIGRIAPGLRADIVLWSGDPLDPASRVERTIIDGVVVYDRSRVAPAQGEEL